MGLDADELADRALTERVYDELRAMAAAYLRREPDGHTLQPTALVHEVWLKLEGQPVLGTADRARFLPMAAQAMRRILIDHARRKRSGKRGGRAERVPLPDAAEVLSNPQIDVLDLDEKIRELARIDARKARVVELRFFAGLGVQEVAEVLGLHHRTIEVDWLAARAWLRTALSG